MSEGAHAQLAGISRESRRGGVRERIRTTQVRLPAALRQGPADLEERNDRTYLMSGQLAIEGGHPVTLLVGRVAKRLGTAEGDDPVQQAIRVVPRMAGRIVRRRRVDAPRAGSLPVQSPLAAYPVATRAVNPIDGGAGSHRVGIQASRCSGRSKVAAREQDQRHGARHGGNSHASSGRTRPRPPLHLPPGVAPESRQPLYSR